MDDFQVLHNKLYNNTNKSLYIGWFFYYKKIEPIKFDKIHIQPYNNSIEVFIRNKK